MKPWTEAELAYEEAVAPDYDAYYYGDPIPKAHLRRFFRLIRRYAGKKELILDLGGGTGAVTEQLVQHGYERLVTIDLSLAMLQQAKKKLPGIRTIVCNAEHLPFKADVFQTIICSSVLHHVPYPGGILREMKRSLALYGVVIAQEPNKSPFLIQPAGEKLGGRVMDLMHYLYRIERYVPAQEPPVHQYHRAFTRQELVSLFSEHLYILEFQSRFAFSYVFTKLRSKVLCRLILMLDGCLAQEGSVFHVVGSKTDAGHRQLLRNYFQLVEGLRKEPQGRLSGILVLSLLPLIVLGRVYEFYSRIRTKLRGTG